MQLALGAGSGRGEEEMDHPQESEILATETAWSLREPGRMPAN